MQSRLFRILERATLAMARAKPNAETGALALLDPSDPVALVTLLDVDGEKIGPLITTTRQWLGGLYRIVYLTNNPDFLPFRKAKALFEHVPSAAEWARHGSAVSVETYLAERYHLLTVKWRPKRLLVYGTPFSQYADAAVAACAQASDLLSEQTARSIRTVQILFVADPRFEGGTSTALAAELLAADRAGLSIGLLMTKAARLTLPLPVHPEVASLVARGAATLVDPDDRVEADLVVIHHPMTFALPATRRLDVRARTCVLVLHHPYRDGLSAMQYDLAAVVANCRAAFGLPVALAPVSDVVRNALPLALPTGAKLLPENWSNVIDTDAFAPCDRNAPTWPVTVGRHARADPAKWPDDPAEAMLAYPTDPARYRVRILGSGPFLEALYGPLPLNWERADFAFAGVRDFLRSLDFYVYFHGSVWIEAYGRTILEALATGLVVILPETFAPLFGPAAVYTTPRGVRDVIARFVADPARYREQAARARQFATDQARLGLFVDRVNRLFAIEPGASRPQPPLPRQSVLFVSTNGIGLGHLTQQMAIVRRLPDTAVPVFATMSLALKIAVEAGILVHFIPHHRRLGASAERWNKLLAEELFEIIAMTRPRLIAFDGTMPFAGLLDALAQFPDILSVWVRRPMFQDCHQIAVDQSDRFDAVIEPGELADALDIGPTKPDQPNVFLVPPVLYLDPAERLDRETARSALGVHDDELVVAFQLGSGNNFDVEAIRGDLIARILADPRTVVLDFISPIGEERSAVLPTHPRHRLVELFPSFRFSAAFDFAVSAAGYNAFHENTFGGIPSIYVPNEGVEMDVQLARATFADVHGLGLLLRRDHDRYRVDMAVAQMLDPEVRDVMRAGCLALPFTNGAGAIADFIAHMARFLRADYPITDAWKDIVTRGAQATPAPATAPEPNGPRAPRQPASVLP